MFERIEPVDVFVRRMGKWPTDEIWEEIHSNNQAIFFHVLELRELDDLSCPRALKVHAWISEMVEDNKAMVDELERRLQSEFMPYLNEVLSQILGEGGPDA